FFETTPENLPGWFNDAVVVGDPYDAGSAGTDRPVYVKELRRGLTELRGAFYQDEFWAPQVAKREVAISSASGWTDDLFPPVADFRQFKYLKSLDRLWPVEVAVADVGHPRAQNPAFEWHPLNDRAWGFLKEQIHGSHRQQTTVLTMPTICPPAGDETGPVQHLTGRTPEELASGTLTVQYATPAGFDSLPSGMLDLPLFGNHWMLAAGHKVRLDLTQVDFPTFLPGNSMDALIAFPSADLVLPTREATTLTFPGA